MWTHVKSRLPWSGQDVFVSANNGLYKSFHKARYDDFAEMFYDVYTGDFIRGVTMWERAYGKDEEDTGTASRQVQGAGAKDS